MLLTLFKRRKWTDGWALGVLLVFVSAAVAQNSPNSVAIAAKDAKSVPTNAPTPSSTPSILPVPSLGGLAQSNPFDPDRKLWRAKVPLPPPPPVPALVTEDDLSIYGNVMAGGVQKVILKPGKRFESVPIGPTGMASVYVGSQLGEFVLAQVMPDQILLSAPGGQQWVRIGRKNDRSGTNAAARNPTMQSLAGAASAETTPSAPAPQANPFAQLAGEGNPVPASGLGGGLALLTASPPGSLAAAIAAAQAKQASQPSPAAPMINPFEALIQQQKLGR